MSASSLNLDQTEIFFSVSRFPRDTREKSRRSDPSEEAMLGITCSLAAHALRTRMAARAGTLLSSK